MATNLGPNQKLIGIPGGRGRLSTPSLVLDLDAFEQNLTAMARHCQRIGQGLRPHAKSHKSVTIARRQIAAGALGVCCATVREAEAMIEAGIAGVLLTSPVTTAAKIERVLALHAKSDQLMVAVDSPVAVEALAKATAGTGRPLKLVVDFDVGLGRTGVRDDEVAATLARLIADRPTLAFAGVQAYAGQLQHVVEYRQRVDGAMAQAARLKAAVERLTQLGLKPGIVTGGGTGTHDIDHRAGVFTELQAGSYLFTDVDYNRVRLREDSAMPFKPSLFVQAAVVSTDKPGYAVIDAGLKSFATDGPVPEIVAGAPPGATYKFMGDEHGRVIFAQPGQRLEVGAILSLLVPHCDPTVNLYDVYHCVRGQDLVDIWPIEARGNP